jgi:hypothetical protein
MTNYPSSIDDDLTIPRIEDGVTEYTSDVINALRDAIITVESILGIDPQGTVNDIVTRLAVSLNDDGTLKSSALSVPPIINSMVAAGAGIVESKLSLDVSTSTLNTNLSTANTLISGINIVLSELVSEYAEHIYGLATSPSDYLNRHVASHIDINKDQTIIPVSGVDPRDTLYTNPGLYNVNGTIRTSTDLMSVLIDINNDLINHLLSLTNTHPATFITLSTANFSTIPTTNNTVQKAIDYLDTVETTAFQEHGSEAHSNGIPRSSNVTLSSSDTYNTTYGPYIASADTTSYNYDKIVFETSPAQTGLDWAFKDTVVGDTVTVTYDSFSVSFIINSITYTAGASYELVINGKHPDTGVVSVTIEKSHYDENKYGVLAVVPANHEYNNYYGGLIPEFASVPSSAIVISPNCAQVTGLDLALDELDSTHCMLYLGFYPTGNPIDSNLKFPLVQAIDVTGNLGATPGQYTLAQIIYNTNLAFRSGGYNYRFCAFEYKGQFGLALSDTIDNAGFSIISGTNSSTVLTTGVFINNVVGDATSPIKDPLGLGGLKAAVASPDYNSVTTTNTPTKVFLSKQNKNFNVNGQFIDYLADGYNTTDGYYPATLTTITAAGTRKKGTYRVNLDLSGSKLKKGSTIVVAPILTPSGSNFYFDYGRFIVEDLSYSCCPGAGYTDITVITCTSLLGDEGLILADPSVYELPVKIYFSDDSVSFNVDSIGNFRRLFEVYIKKEGETFSHLRAQFQLVGGTTTLLATDLGTSSSGSFNTDYGWHIIDVSPKLRGFIKTGGSDLLKYVRLFILNYNSTDDTFDGYIGQADSILPTSTNNGAVVKSRKGKVTRYYDNTGVDYIDIIFQDKVLDPYAIYCPAGESRYVDIQIFETMRTNDEFMCIATCEQFIKGGPNATLWFFQDKREFGTVSEKVLSSSAIRFIEASDRLTKQNGVCFGFEYISSPTASSIVLNGGTAIIDGVVVNKNNFTVNAYKLYITGTTTVNFALCLTKDNSYELVPIADTSVTTTYNTGAVYVYTLSQLLETRKDLLPIYILPVTSTSSVCTIGTPLDIRFFINDLEEKVPVVVSGNSYNGTTNSTILGNFSTLKAASNYIQYSNNMHSTVRIKGEIYISESISFGGKPVSIIGEKGNIVYCTIDGVAINLASNMEIVGVNFSRRFGTADTSAQPYATGYGKATLGLVMLNGSLEYENITIKDCTFATYTGYRESAYSHILFEQTGDGAILTNINIVNNKFKEEEAQLCIAFVNKGGVALTAASTDIGTILNDVTIENNKGNFNSYIILSSDNYYGESGRNSRGLSAYNLKICKNTFDYVWLNLSRSVLDSYKFNSTFTVYDKSYPQFRPGVVISENSFNGIIAKSIDGLILFPSNYVIKVPSPSTFICNNMLSTVYLLSNSDIHNSATTDVGRGELIISNNIFNVSYYSAANFSPSDTPTAATSVALQITGNLVPATATNIKNIININNNIFQDKIKDYTSTTYYSACIYIYLPANINNNTISECIQQYGYGIYLSYNNGGTNVYTANISNNNIYRGTTVIGAYIRVVGTTKLKQIIINDNYFDQTTIDDASNTALISYTSSYAYKLTTQRNKNDTLSIDLIPYMEDNGVSFYTLPGLTSQISGWMKSSRYIEATSPAAYSLKKFVIPECANNLYTSTSYYTGPLILDMPCIDGSNLTTINLLVQANLASPKNITVLALAPDTLTPYPDVIISPFSSDFTVTTTPSIFTSNTTITSISIDMSTLPTKYPTLKSNSKTFPIYILFAVDVSTNPTMFTFTKSDPYVTSTEYFNIYSITGTFTY